MKYNLWVRFLKVLVYGKRFFWLLGTGVSYILVKTIGGIGRSLLFIRYKFLYFLKKTGLHRVRAVLLKREVLQVVGLVTLFWVGFPQSKLYAQKDLFLPGQKTIAYAHPTEIQPHCQ
jgi:hypothetical protein